jgi:DNA polymerase-1
VKADLSQIELRIAAEISGDDHMLSAFQRGEDLHTVTAAAVLNKKPDQITPHDRQAAKALNFGLTYGMGAATLRESAASSYGVSLTLEQAQEFRRRFLVTYRGVRNWHRAQGTGITETRTLAGRRRLGVESFTERLNTPVQGTAADGFKAALALLSETRDKHRGVQLVAAVHDEVVVECPIYQADEVGVWLQDSMQRAMGSFLRHVPVVVDVTIATDWSGSR